jgi:cell division protein FtsI/penicillin-binding protein 2
MVIKRNKKSAQYIYRNNLRRNKKNKIADILKQGLEKDSQNRLFFLIFFVSLIIIALISRLFYLQILKGDYYFKEAVNQQYGKIVIPAKRGEIFARNSKNGKISALATNTSLDLIYIDPQEIPDSNLIAEKLAPILFDEESFLACKEDYTKCPQGRLQFQEDYTDLSDEKKENKIKDTRTKKELIKAYEQEIYQKIQKKYVDYSPLLYGALNETLLEVQDLGLKGVYVLIKKDLVYANPQEISETQIKTYAKKLAPIIKLSKEEISEKLTKRKIRYIPLKRKLSPEISEKIKELKSESYENYKKDSKNTPHYWKGVVLIPEHWRYYPEKNLASTVVGYVDHSGVGNYGVEEKLQTKLKGKEGEIKSKNDVNGSQLVFDADSRREAEDGKSYVLTIDRVIQKKAEELLSASVESYNADFGNIIVMNPNNGQILAMADYPNFDPNNFGEVYKMKKATREEFEEEKIYPTQDVFIKNEKGMMSKITYKELVLELEAIKEAEERIKNGEKDLDENGKEIPIEIPEWREKYVFENRLGLRAYLSRNVMETYEPGSVFKPIAMAIGLDSGEVTPFETYEETGPIEIDTGTGEKQYIHTALDVYRGTQTMTNALEQSSNIGMAYVARKLGRQLFYDYILDFGFGDYTYISLAGEQKGQVTYYKKWPEAQLLTTSFGQGISATPLQMITAFSAILNGGNLLEPHIVYGELEEDGKITKKPINLVRRVVSEKASEEIKSMLVSSVENGVAEPGKVEGYKIGGKTGTSQIACSDGGRCTLGKYEKGEGSTITSFAGFAPIKKPKFVVLVKFERPRIGDNTWGSTTAAPVFQEMTEFLLNYYDIKKED